jgi:hypothetical protein
MHSLCFWREKKGRKEERREDVLDAPASLNTNPKREREREKKLLARSFFSWKLIGDQARVPISII